MMELMTLEEEEERPDSLSPLHMRTQGEARKRVLTKTPISQRLDLAPSQPPEL